jgi:hypothetical protein
MQIKLIFLTFISFIIATMMVESTLAYAAEDAGTTAGASADVSSSGKEMCRYGGRRGAIEFTPRYYRLVGDRYLQAFTGNGIQDPGKDAFGFGVNFYHITQTDWYLGLGFNEFGLSKDTGTSHAEYGQYYIGLIAGKSLPVTSEIDILPSVLAGYGYGEANVFSSVKSGRWSESSFVVEPKISANYLASKHVKVGVSVAYLFPLATSSEIKGQDLGLDKLTARTWSVGLNLLLGSFGAE